MANAETTLRSRRVRWLWIGAAVAVAATIALSLLPEPVEADFATVSRGDVEETIVDEGRTRMHDLYVVSSPVAGRVLRVQAEPGDDVAAGAVLARMARAAAGFLDTRTDLQSRAAVDAARARVDAAQADLALAQRESERTRQLAEAKLVSGAATDQAQARLEAAQAARSAAAAELVRARSALLDPDRVARGLVDVRSPAAGRVLRVPQESEAVIPAGTPLVEVGDPSRVEVVAEFLSQDAVRMQPGSAALIENWGGPALPASVERVEPVARTKVSALGVEEQRTNVILQFADPSSAARLGHDFRVDARVTVARSPGALRVPLGALFRREDGWAVYRVSGGRIALTPVATGIADASWRVVTDGLAEGDTVVAFPANTLKAGDRVRARGGG